MAQLIYNAAGNTGFDMRSLDLDALLAGKTVTAFNPSIIQWKDGTTQATLYLLGQDLNPTVSGGALTGLTGTALTQIWVPNVAGTAFGLNIVGLTGPSSSVSDFYDLVQAKNWVGLAAFVRQGDDTIIGTKNNDILMGGAGNDTFTSSAGRDRINGGAGNDTMEAMGGHDVMIGGSGADQFAFGIEPIAGEDWWVTIQDFKSGTDRISVSDTAFEHVGFGGFSGAVLEAVHFGYGKQAKTGDQGLIYDKAKGFLFYDADGSGGFYDRVLLAKLGAGTDLSFQDFWVV
jgi:Ca2+-binding RTX toxin-like protein